MCREVQAVKLSERYRRQGKARPPSEAVAAVLADPRLLDPLRDGGDWGGGGGYPLKGAR